MEFARAKHEDKAKDVNDWEREKEMEQKGINGMEHEEERESKSMEKTSLSFV